MFREAIGLFVPEPKAKLYILSKIGVSDGGEFTRTDS